MPSSPQSGPPQSATEDTLRDTWHDCRDWWSNRATTGQKIATAAFVIACAAMIGAALAHSLGVFAGVRTTISWTDGTYTVPPQCTDSSDPNGAGIVSMKINNATSASVTVEVDEPRYYDPHQPLYLRENSDNPTPTVTVPAHGSVIVYLKLGDKSLECTNDATDILKVVATAPPTRGSVLLQD